MPEAQSSSDKFEVDYQYAGFWHRFAALFIDGLILLIPHIILNHIAPIAGSVLLVLFYKPIFESSPLMATPGKALMGIIVVSEQGGRISYKQALIRCLMAIVSGMCLFIGYLISLFTARHQTLHDLVAETIVINQEMPRENFFDIWVHEMKYIFGRGSSEIFSSGPREAQSPRAEARGMNQSAVEALEKLHKLYTDGVITEAEFLAKKAELLQRI